MFLYVCAFLVATVVVGRQFPANERYIILLEKESDAGDIEELIQSMEVHASSTREEMQVRSLTSLLPFVIGNMSVATAEMVSKLANVELISKDQVVHLDSSIEQGDSPNLEELLPIPYRYNLDILDNVNCTDGTFKPDNFGLGVDIYSISSGINFDHIDFRWRDGDCGSRAKWGLNANEGDYSTSPAAHNYVGTQAAGVAGGVVSGIAKDANLYSVRVFPPGGMSKFLDGLDYVGKAHKENSKRSDFVGSIASIYFASNNFPIEVLMAAEELWDLGVVVVVPIGNQWADGCKEGTLCGSERTICVGAHGYDTNTCDKKMYSSSNYGPCVDIMAPGIDIWTASSRNNIDFTMTTGTDLASYHVVGVAALMKAADPTLCPAEIRQRIMGYAVDDIDRSDMPSKVQETSRSKRLFVSPDLFD